MMTENVNLPDDVQWVTDDLAVAIVPGETERHWCFNCDRANENECHACDRYVAPQEWAQYDKLCETCEHSGWPGYVPAEASEMSGTALNDCGGGAPFKRCPDCRDGRQVVEVRWECPNIVCIDNPYAECPVCDQSGYLSATLQVVPVTLRPDYADDGDFPVVWVNPTERWVKLVMDARTVYHPTFDPLPLVGHDFGVILKKKT